MKKLMIGNEAVAAGALDAGVRLISSYPGTPSTEITEFAAKSRELPGWMILGYISRIRTPLTRVLIVKFY